jgi:hypothetical protein
MVYVVLQRIILVQMESPVLRLFYTESYFSGLCGFTKNHARTTRDSRVYVVLLRITLVQISTSGGSRVYVIL